MEMPSIPSSAPNTSPVAPQMLRPRLIDNYGIIASQNSLDFAIPFINEDIPLYVDPFLLWKSPSQQDQSLHETVINAFNLLGHLSKNGKVDEAIQRLCTISECAEVGLGSSAKRVGKKIGAKKAEEILALFGRIPHYSKFECRHMEETQLYVDGVSKDRISDFTCNFIKSFLIDFTIDQCQQLGIPMVDVLVNDVYSTRDKKFMDNYKAKLPHHPVTGERIIFVPKRWLRHVPWITYEDYFRGYCPQDDVAHKGEVLDHVKVLQYNIANYGIVEGYVKEKERTVADCQNDPLFTQMPIVSAKRQLTALKKLSSGNTSGEGKAYEDIMEALFPSLLYPHLDFAQPQSRTISGSSIRDLIFYNNRDHAFLLELFNDYGSRQIVFELKNVASVESDHIDQISRYLPPGLGNFGVIVTRNELTKARLQQTVDLWSAHRKAIVIITDADIEMMVQVFESKQRSPIDVIKKKYVDFRRACPT